MSRLIDMTGKRVGVLVLLCCMKSKQGREAHWLCRCDRCGARRILPGSALRRWLEYERQYNLEDATPPPHICKACRRYFVDGGGK